MKDQRKKIVRRPKDPLSVYIKSKLDRFRMNRPSGPTYVAGDQCPLPHRFPRKSNAHRDPNPDPGAQDAEQVGGSNLVKHDGGGGGVKQNKDGGEVSSWFQRGFGSSELLFACRGFDGRRGGWDAGIGGSTWGSANDGVSSWEKAGYSGSGGGEGPSWSSLGDGGSGFVGGVNCDFNSKNEETNAGGGWDETNAGDDAWKKISLLKLA